MHRISRLVFVALLGLSVVPMGGCDLASLTYALPLELTSSAQSDAVVTTPHALPPAPKSPEALVDLGDVQAACGQTGLSKVAKGAKAEAIGDVNFADSTGRVILTATFGDERAYRSWQALATQYRGDVDGVGDAAFDGPSPALSPVPTRLTFLKAGRTVALVTYSRPDGLGGLLSEEQLRQVAAAIIARL